MKASENAIDLIKSFEGFRNFAYLDTGHVATIGYGSIKYPNQQKVRLGDFVSQERANEMLKFDLCIFEDDINHFVTSNINQNQFDALICFIYNIGSTQFRRSTLLKKVNLNPNDPSIKDEFKKWRYDNGKIITGLLNRRIKEADLYFKND